MKFITFYINEICYGIDILKVQEINRFLTMTPVPQAPDYVEGILNLRGQIITIIDPGKKLGLISERQNKAKFNIIVKSQSEYIGLQVDDIGDVKQAKNDEIKHPPANIKGIQGKFFDGVFGTEKNLIGILNLDEALGIDD